jgi:hypothetical protein
MNKTQKKQLEKFYKVYEQVYLDYAIKNNEIAQKTGIHRSYPIHTQSTCFQYSFFIF